jgi:hypothetical protein
LASPVFFFLSSLSLPVQRLTQDATKIEREKKEKGKRKEKIEPHLTLY